MSTRVSKTATTSPVKLSGRVLLVLGLACSLVVNAANPSGEICPIPKINNARPTGYVTGAGAHFSWIIFDALKKDLEAVSNRKILLYGKDSMLGQGCNAGIKNARLNGPGKESFGFVCCPLSQQEIKKKGIRVHPIAIEPILILVNRQNPVTNLSSQQVRDIFSGKIINWKDVGGRDQPIAVVTRLHCKKRPGHWKTILSSKKEFRKLRLNVSSADEMVRRVSDFSGAIGHVGATWLFETGNMTKAISIDGQAATAANLDTGKYPFHRTLSAITDKNPSDDIMKIIKEVQTGDAFFRVAKRFELLPLNEPESR